MAMNTPASQHAGVSSCTVTTTDATSKATSFDIGFVQWGPITLTKTNDTNTNGIGTHLKIRSNLRSKTTCPEIRSNLRYKTTCLP
jgi:hypothetical protein